MTTRRELVGVPVDVMTMADTISWVGASIEARRPVAHLCVNAANVATAHDDPAYLALLEDADVVGADGASMVWAGRVLGVPLPERVTGIDLMAAICAGAPSAGWRIGLLGSRADVVERVAAKLRGQGVDVAFVHDGYLDGFDLGEVARDAAVAGTDVLFVGMPSPAKEIFVIEHARPAGVPVTIGVGGAFDVVVGDLRRAPMVWQRAGLEWLYRLLQEPRRLFKRYAVTNTRFVWAVGRERLRHRLARRSA
jgi:N-acetylglucosaminyldiphosphoundecaprenol N-acetyl-beta-D-mannosaminyltransferase